MGGYTSKLCICGCHRYTRDNSVFHNSSCADVWYKAVKKEEADLKRREEART